jgi:GntR family transcriptional regulator
MLSDTPAYEQIKMQIKEAVLKGTIAAGTQLPSIRLMAKDLSVGIITVKRAYEELEKENIIVSIQGKGSFVNEIDKATIKKINLQMLEERMSDIKEFADASGIDMADLQNIIQKLWRSRDV